MARTYVVTGAASGIGAATAARLEAAGDRVIRVDLHDADVAVDLGAAAGRAELVTAVTGLAGDGVDGVVVNAGTVGRGPGDVRVNYFGAVATLAGLRPLLAGSPAARAVATTSVALVHGVDDVLVEACLAGDEDAAARRVEEASLDRVTIYASTKRALARWVRRAAPSDAWAGAGIGLNAVAPGVVRTPMTRAALDDPRGAQLLAAATPTPYGGVMDPDVVAGAIQFLLAPVPAGITGQVLFVDGGADCVLRGDDVWP